MPVDGVMRRGRFPGEVIIGDVAVFPAEQALLKRASDCPEPRAQAASRRRRPGQSILAGWGWDCSTEQRLYQRRPHKQTSARQPRVKRYAQRAANDHSVEAPDSASSTCALRAETPASSPCDYIVACGEPRMLVLDSFKREVRPPRLLPSNDPLEVAGTIRREGGASWS